MLTKNNIEKKQRKKKTLKKGIKIMTVMLLLRKAGAQLQ